MLFSTRRLYAGNTVKRPNILDTLGHRNRVLYSEVVPIEMCFSVHVIALLYGAMLPREIDRERERDIKKSSAKWRTAFGRLFAVILCFRCDSGRRPSRTKTILRRP